MNLFLDGAVESGNPISSVQLAALFTSALLGAISLALNLLVKRTYLISWAIGWLCFLSWLVFDMIQDSAMIKPAFPVKDGLIGLSAILFAAASLKCRGVRVASIDLFLMSVFVFMWSVAANLFLVDRLLVEAPLFSMLGLTAFATSWSFCRRRSPSRQMGTTVLIVGFIVWGGLLLVHPFCDVRGAFQQELTLLLCITQCCIAVGVVILVMEDALEQKNAFRNKLAMIVQDRRRLRSDVESVECVLSAAGDAYAGCNLSGDDIAHRVSQAQARVTTREVSRTVRKLAGDLSHYFNNRLTPIVALSDIALISDESRTDLSRSNLELIRTSALEIADVIGKFRMFASNETPLQGGEMVSVRTLMQDLKVSAFRLAAGMPDPATVEVIDPTHGDGTEGVLTDHPIELSRALEAILENAMEASSAEQGIRISASVGSIPDSTVRIRFEDHGRGMNEEALQRCFEPFFTTKPPNTASPGLGLAACKGVVERHRGSVRVESTLGVGTIVEVTLPVARR